MAQWHKDGRPIDEAALADLGLIDGDALCEYGGAVFHFTVETVPARQSSRAYPHCGTVVLRLRQLNAPPPHAIHLVDYVDADQLGGLSCGDDRLLDEAGQTASRAVRRYVGAQLFQRAEELLAAA